MNIFCKLFILHKVDVLYLPEIIWVPKSSLIREPYAARYKPELLYTHHLPSFSVLESIRSVPQIVDIDLLILCSALRFIMRSLFFHYTRLMEYSKSSLIDTFHSSADPNIGYKNKIGFLHSNHEERPVYAEFLLCSQLCMPGRHVIFFNTIIEYLSCIGIASCSNCPWSEGSKLITTVFSLNIFIPSTQMLSQ